MYRRLECHTKGNIEQIKIKDAQYHMSLYKFNLNQQWDITLTTCLLEKLNITANASEDVKQQTLNSMLMRMQNAASISIHWHFHTKLIPLQPFIVAVVLPAI